MEQTMEQLISQAKAHGFTNAGAVDVSTLDFLDEVRNMCSVDLCQQYDTNWTCPPALGSIKECRKKTEGYRYGLLVQTTKKLDDPFDYEEMMRQQEKHQSLMLSFTPKIKPTVQSLLPMGAGACSICPECSYPQQPCLHPDLAFAPMEGYGLMVSDVCRKNDIPYTYGEGTLTYIGLYLMNY